MSIDFPAKIGWVCSEICINGKEIWIVMESQNSNDKLSLLIQDKSLSDVIIDNIILLRIEPFSDEEKKKLVEICNVDKSYADFTYARYICNGYAKNEPLIFEQLKDKDKHFLNFLYLLSITQVFIDMEKLEDNISHIQVTNATFLSCKYSKKYS